MATPYLLSEYQGYIFVNWEINPVLKQRELVLKCIKGLSYFFKGGSLSCLQDGFIVCYKVPRAVVLKVFRFKAPQHNFCELTGILFQN